MSLLDNVGDFLDTVISAASKAGSAYNEYVSYDTQLLLQSGLLNSATSTSLLASYLDDDDDDTTTTQLVSGIDNAVLFLGLMGMGFVVILATK